MRERHHLVAVCCLLVDIASFWSLFLPALFFFAQRRSVTCVHV